jgi:nitrate reductase NapE component
VPESDVLLAISEVAVAFAGFASLVSILGRGTSLDDPRVLSVRMRAMLLTSLLVVAFSLFPILVFGYGAGLGGVWIGSSLALLAASLWYYHWLRSAILALGRAGLTPSRFQRRVIIPTLQLTLIAVATLLTANALVARPAMYLTALALLLFQSGFAFSLIVFSFLPRIDDQPRRPGQDLEED